jgi:hypothetical protein
MQAIKKHAFSTIIIEIKQKLKHWLKNNNPLSPILRPF